MKYSIIRLIRFLLPILLVLFVVYYYPRRLKDIFGEDHFLLPYLYLYGLGIPFFIFNMYLMIRYKGLQLHIPGEKKWMLIFICGLICSFILHSVWILLATQIPFKGLV